MPTHELTAASPGLECVGLADDRDIGALSAPAVRAGVECPGLVVVQAGLGIPSIEQRVIEALRWPLRWHARRNIVTNTIGNPRLATERPMRRRASTPATSHRNTETACASVSARTTATVLVRPRHIAPRQRGAGRPNSRRSAVRSRSPGGGDSSDPGEDEPAGGRSDSTVRVRR
jgi:hypothetical protein